MRAINEGGEGECGGEDGGRVTCKRVEERKARSGGEVMWRKSGVDW